MRRTLPRGHKYEYSKRPEKDGVDGHKRAGDAVQVVRGGVLALGVRKSQARKCADLVLVSTRDRAQVRAAPWIVRREQHDGGEKSGEGDENGRVEGTYRQPVAGSPTASTVPRATSSTPKCGGEGGEGGGGAGGGGTGEGAEYRSQGRPRKRGVVCGRPPQKARPRR